MDDADDCCIFTGRFNRRGRTPELDRALARGIMEPSDCTLLLTHGAYGEVERAYRKFGSDSYGLWLLVMIGDPALLEAAVLEGYDVVGPDRYQNWSTLWLAAENARVGIVRYLAERFGDGELYRLPSVFGGVKRPICSVLLAKIPPQGSLAPEHSLKRIRLVAPVLLELGADFSAQFTREYPCSIRNRNKVASVAKTAGVLGHFVLLNYTDHLQALVKAGVPISSYGRLPANATNEPIAWLKKASSESMRKALLFALDRVYNPTSAFSRMPWDVLRKVVAPVCQRTFGVSFDALELLVRYIRAYPEELRQGLRAAATFAKYATLEIHASLEQGTIELVIPGYWRGPELAPPPQERADEVMEPQESVERVLGAPVEPIV